MQYDPQPPFNVGSPEKAESMLINATKNLAQEITEAAWLATQEIVARNQ